MPELRQNIITRDWVIIATERARRPDQFISQQRIRKGIEQYHPDCPFCPGNEQQTQRELFRVSNGRQWKVRVVENKYAALHRDGERIRSINGVYRSMTAVGFHEVVIEHPRHDMTTALMSVDEVADVLTAYRQRYIEMKKDPRIEAIIIFKNHGEGAGTSLQHPHSQIAATPIVPTQIRSRIEDATRYFDETGECIFCRTLREELLHRERIVFESEHFIAFIPYAALSPFHLWIFPRRHTSSFDDLFDAELGDLAVSLKSVLGKIYHGLNDPDYNYSIRSLPTRDRHTDYFHWYLTIVPRVSRTAGFEIGSGMFINTSLPEESAKFLRTVKVDA
jgi:UDPglucose--hexose-1-phosphate uridylyltransferase